MGSVACITSAGKPHRNHHANLDFQRSLGSVNFAVRTIDPGDQGSDSVPSDAAIVAGKIVNVWYVARSSTREWTRRNTALLNVVEKEDGNIQ